MKIVYFSDSHGLHKQLNLQDGDVLICGGGFTAMGKEDEVMEFIDWFSNQPHKYKIFVAGRSERALDMSFPGSETMSSDLINKMIDYAAVKTHFYLESTTIEIEGVVFHGTPYRAVTKRREPFTVNEGHEAASAFSSIPKQVDVLITRYPPYMLRDFNPAKGINEGDKHLRQWVDHRMPKLILTGELIHSYGVQYMNGMCVLNGCTCDPFQQHLRDPFSVYYDKKKGSTRVFTNQLAF